MSTTAGTTTQASGAGEEKLPDGVNRVALLTEPGTIVMDERPMPQVGPHDVLVEVTAVGVCGSDVHYYEHGRIGSFIVEQPLILGHEAAGRVVEIGSDVTRHKVGDRVALEPGIPCGHCRECRAGNYNLCPDVQFFATPPVDGTFARYVAHNEYFAFTLPETMSDAAGGLMEPLSVGIWSCKRSGVTGGSRVLITGAGPIGLLTLQVARAYGATQVEVSDVRPERLELAERMGATRTLIAGQDEPAEADILIECAGNQSALHAGLNALRPAGVAVAVGLGPNTTVEVPIDVIQSRELWLTGSFRYANTYPTAIALAASGAVDVESIVTGHFGLDESEAALRAGIDSDGAIKVVVYPQYAHTGGVAPAALAR